MLTEGFHGSTWVFPQEVRGLGSVICTHLWVERKLHMGFVSKAKLGEVIEYGQEMVICCQCVFITDTQL